MRKVATLFDSIEKIRMLAASIYDSSEAQGVPHEQIQKKLEPLRHMLDSCVKVAEPRDLMQAMKDFEAVAEGHLIMIKFYQNKLKDLQHHAESVEKQLIERMKSSESTYLSDGDFVATLVKDGELERVSIR